MSTNIFFVVLAAIYLSQKVSKISFVSVIFPSLVEKSEISNILISVQRKYFCIFIDILALRNY